MSLKLDVEIVVKVRNHREGDIYREVHLDATVTLNGVDGHLDAATAEAAVRALEDSGPVARRTTGQLPFMSEVNFRHTPISHSLQEHHGVE